MKQLSVLIACLTLGARAGFAGTADIYINNAPLVGLPPQIDARAFLNRSIFDVSTTLPFQAQHVLFWTNTGVMNGTAGFHFENSNTGTAVRNRRIRRDSRNLRRSSSVFVNDGSISASFFNTLGIVSGLGSPVLFINATNVSSQGRLDGTEQTIISVLATNGTADLSRGGIRVGPDITGLFTLCDTTPFGSNYFLDPKVTELYWGAGRNNDLGTNGQPLDLRTLLASNIFAGALNFSLPNPFTPLHQVISRATFSRGFFTNQVRLPGGFFFGGFFGGCSSGYEAHVFTNALGSDITVNIVFVPTNNLLSPSNLFTSVRFDAFNAGTFGQVPANIIEFRSVDFDIVEQRLTTNYVTLVDVTGSRTNVFLARPFATTTTTGAQAGNTRRPSTYNLFTGRYCSFDFMQEANSPYNQSIFYNPNFETNTVETIYAGYSAHIGPTNTTAISGVTVSAAGLRRLGVDPGLSDPTNFSGRVEISARRLDINNTRIRAENFIGIKATDLVSNALATVDAPFINLDVASSQPELVISDIAPDSVSRLLGRISAWSSAWTVNVTNAPDTNTVRYRFHVTLVDNCLQAQQPVTLHRFAARSTNLVIRDNLFVNGSFRIDAAALTVDRGGSVNLPLGANLAFTNLHNLLHLTNSGAINAQGASYFGVFEAGHVGAPLTRAQIRRMRRFPPRAVFPLDNFVNHGQIAAASVFVGATNVSNVGARFVPATLTANGGVVSVVGRDVTVADAEIKATSDVELRAENLRLGNTLITAGTTNNAFNQYVRGVLVLGATNTFGDLGPGTTNDWFVTAGVRMTTRPQVAGDLMGTRIYLTAGPLVQSTFVWAGEDRGASASGFVNNLALGRLVLDGLGGNLFRFQGAGANNALYVDYLELLNDATNYNFAVGVAPDFTIYFADANIPPDKLDNVGGGRLRWLSSVTGPQSSTNITYPNGVTYTFNAGLVRSRDIDSDGDGFVNAQDCTPIPVPDFDTTGPQCPGGMIPPPPVLKSVAAAGANAPAVTLGISRSAGGDEVVLEWVAPPGSTGRVEFSDSLSGGSWQTLAEFVNGPVERVLTARDAVSAPLRVYRVRVDADNP